jgi:hypothetical protein
MTGMDQTLSYTLALRLSHNSRIPHSCLACPPPTMIWLMGCVCVCVCVLERRGERFACAFSRRRARASPTSHHFRLR